MRHSFVSFLALAAGLTLAQAANAQPARIDLSTPPPPPAVQRTHHVHDGFYTRLSLGLGSLGLDFDDDGSRNVDLDGSGLAFSADIMIGGSPSPGVAIGGALLGTASFSLELEQNGRSVGDRDVGMVILGPFIDGFPNPKQGWHIGGAVGVAGMDIENPSAEDDISSLRGFGGAAWAGYDWWVGSEWSAGLLARLHGALVRRDRDNLDVTASALGFSLMFTGLYH